MVFFHLILLLVSYSYFSMLVFNFAVNGVGSRQSSAAGFHRFMTAVNAPTSPAPPISLNIRRSQNRPSPTA